MPKLPAPTAQKVIKILEKEEFGDQGGYPLPTAT